MTITRRLRFEILRRDSYTCRYCGASAPDAKLTVDHVIPTALGGGDEPNNLVAACSDCNAGKSSIQPDSPLVEDVDATAMLFAKAMERVAERRRAEMSDRLDRQYEFLETFWNPILGSTQVRTLPPDWWLSISRFLDAGLDMPDLEHFIYITSDKNVPLDYRFKYFCGCCWRELTRRQEEARQLIEDGEV